MSKGYADTKAAEALARASGDRHLAATLLAAWAESDGKLRESLLGPFLKSLCAYAVQRAASKTASSKMAGKGAAAAAKRKSDKPGDAVDAVVAALGKASGSRTFGVPERAPRKQVTGSAKHEQSVRALATAFRAKRRP
ncbi:MAG: hypothetical protein FJX35_24970 [Alphaproteobacteria bacterium]|nr:hypothetical protein [Alphaproteobacteria bacterium]